MWRKRNVVNAERIYAHCWIKLNLAINLSISKSLTNLDTGDTGKVQGGKIKMHS